jgi:Family of unknown function (DUF6221)
MSDDVFAARLKWQIETVFGLIEQPSLEQAGTEGRPVAEDERVTWLQRQIGYEEGGARQAAKYNATTWTCISTGVLDYASPDDKDAWPLVLDGSAAQHMADHDPARVLREVRAKRALLAEILALRETAPAAADRMLLCMIAEYADRDAYGWREEWRVPGLDDDGTPRVLDGELAWKELA